MFKNTVRYLLLASTLCGCTLWHLFLAPGPSNDGGPIAGVDTSGPRVQVSARCCWCVVKENGDNEVRPFVGQNFCEKRTDRERYESCREVRVSEGSCEMVHMVNRNTKTVCHANPLHFDEEGKVKAIAPPKALPDVCLIGPEAIEQMARPPASVKNLESVQGLTNYLQGFHHRDEVPGDDGRE